MNETQLISQLTAALDDATGPVRMPAGAAERARARARRRLIRAAATAIPAAGLAAGVALTVAATNPPAVHPGPGSQAQTRTSEASAPPALLTVGYVTSRAKAAAADMSSMIVKQTDGGMITWFDYGKAIARYQMWGTGGRLVWDEREWYTDQTVRHRVYVDYRARTWWTLTQPDSTVAKPFYKGSAAALPIPQDNANGQVSILGHRTIDRKDTILVKFGPPHGYKPTAYSYWATEYLWLDTTTYLPVRATYTGDPGPADTTDFAYLPATAANEAVFDLTAPAGFKRVSPPPFRGDGQPGLGQIP